MRQQFSIIILLFLGISISQQAVAQEYQAPKYKKMPIQLGIISDLDVGTPIRYSPGMMLEYGVQLAHSEKVKGGSYSKKVKDRDFYLKPYVGFYKREDYHTALMLGTEFTYRVTYPAALFWDANIGAAYMHLFYNDPVYVYDPGTQTFEEKKFQGYSNVMIKGSFNIGVDFSKKESGFPLGVYTGAGILFRYPNNTNWVRHPYLQLGLMYTIKKVKK